MRIVWGMEYSTAIAVEDPTVKLVNFLGYEIPEKFSVLFWISKQDFGDPFTVKFYYEIGEEGTPSVMEVRVSGQHPDNFPSHYQGKVFRHQLEWVEENYSSILIGGLQVAIQRRYSLEEWQNGHLSLRKSPKKLDFRTLEDFERQMRKELGSKRKLTPEFYKDILKQRQTYKKKHGSHRGFNEILRKQEGVSVKTVESWVTKAEAALVSKTESKPKRKKKGK